MSPTLAGKFFTTSATCDIKTLSVIRSSVNLGPWLIQHAFLVKVPCSSPEDLDPQAPLKQRTQASSASKPPGSPGTLELTFRTCVLSHFCCVRLCATLWTVACQTPLFIGFSRPEYWSELPSPPPGDLPDPATEPMSLMPPALAGGFFTTELPGKSCGDLCLNSTRLTQCCPSKPSRALTSRVFCRICSRRIRKWPGSLLTSSCRLQQFRHNPAGNRGEARGQSAQGWRELGIPGAALGHYLLMEDSQKILDQHTGPYQAPSR